MSISPAAPAACAHVPLSPGNRISLRALGQIAPDRWQTAAMRAYDGPVVYWITRGQGQLVANGQRHGFSANTLIAVPAKRMHGLHRAGPVSGWMLFAAKDDVASWPDRLIRVTLTDPRQRQDLTARFDLMDQETRNQSLDDAQPALALHAGLLALALHRLGASDAMPGATTPPTQPMHQGAPETASGRLLSRFTAQVETCFAKPDCIRDIAQTLGVTPTHLARVCRQASGRSPHDILSERRHVEARRLIAHTALPLSQIAAATGFASATHFSRAFRKMAGQSPSDFRANHIT